MPDDDVTAPTQEFLRAQLDTLAALADDLAGHFDLQPLLERILGHMVTLLGSDSGSICTVDETAGTYRKEVDLGVGCLSGQTFPLDEGVTGEIVRAGGPVLFDSYSQVRGGHIAPEDRGLLHAVIGVPMMWNGAIIGTCVVFSRDPARRFGAADAALLELFATHAAIAIANARMHALAAERASEAAIMAERERVVRDVHDTVARGLATVLIHLDSAERQLGNKRDPGADVAMARQSAHAALQETRRTVLGLGPSLLDGHSLSEAIELELAWVESTVAIRSQLVTVGEPQTLAADTTRQLFRIVQESLTNVVEHARATTVRVGLVYGSGGVTVLVEDNGRGFDTGPATRVGLGLHGLTARAHHLGGSIQVESTPGWGTRIRAELPYFASGIADEQHSRWRVMVVHENAVMRAGLVRMLALVEPDIQVVGEVADSSEVVDAYELLRPHVVLADMQMPHLDGVQLTSYLRAADPAAAVVLLIDSVADDRVRHAAQIGAAGFIERGIDADGLARAVVAAAQGELLVSPEMFSHFTASAATTGGELTVREREVRTLLERGLPDKLIAAELSISVKTVEKHVGAILRKTGARNRATLASTSRS